MIPEIEYALMAGHAYVMTDGNYTPGGDEENALDLISGTTGNDVIYGPGGDDVVPGGAANDNNYDLERDAA